MPTTPKLPFKETLYYGSQVIIYDSAVELLTDGQVLNKLYAPPKRIDSKLLRFTYGSEVSTLFADNNHNGELDSGEQLIALNVNNTHQLKSVDGLGHGSSREDIEKILGLGRMVEKQLFYFTRGVAFMLDAHEIVTAVTIFSPTAIEPVFDLSIISTAGPIVRTMPWLILGSADESYSMFVNGVEHFFDHYYFLGVTFSGPNNLHEQQLISEILFEPPMLLSSVPAWDSGTDQLIAELSEPDKVQNDGNPEHYVVLMYSNGWNELRFYYLNNCLHQIKISYQL